MKKIIPCIMAAAILFLMTSCTEAPRPDTELFSNRMGKINENYAFEYFDMFVYENAYHVYFSLCSENDVLLSMNLDDNGNINDFTVTASKKNMSTEGERRAFCNFALSANECFARLDSSLEKQLKNEMSFDDVNSYFSDLYETYTCSRYNYIFSSNSDYIFFSCEYFEEMTLEF